MLTQLDKLQTALLHAQTLTFAELCTAQLTASTRASFEQRHSTGSWLRTTWNIPAPRWPRLAKHELHSHIKSTLILASFPVLKHQRDASRRLPCRIGPHVAWKHDFQLGIPSKERSGNHPNEDHPHMLSPKKKQISRALCHRFCRVPLPAKAPPKTKFSWYTFLRGKMCRQSAGFSNCLSMVGGKGSGQICLWFKNSAGVARVVCCDLLNESVQATHQSRHHQKAQKRASGCVNKAMQQRP